MQQRRQRSGLIMGLLSLGLLAGAAVTAGPAQAAEGLGTKFADQAWNRKLPAGTRFLVQTDWNSEVVLDKETGLVWEKSPQTATATWNNARFACIGKTTGGRKGWRLPAIPELASLIDPSVPAPGPVLPVGHPFTNVQSASYWSASSFAGDPADAWVVGFDGGGVGNVIKTHDGILHAWCVRGRMNAEAY